MLPVLCLSVSLQPVNIEELVCKTLRLCMITLITDWYAVTLQTTIAKQKLFLVIYYIL